MNLRHRVTIQSSASTKDETTGDFTPGWSNFATVYANVRPLTAREFVAAAAEQSKVTAMITIRYRPGVKQSMRILHRDQVFNIEGKLPDDNSGIQWLTIPVSEVQDE